MVSSSYRTLLTECNLYVMNNELFFLGNPWTYYALFSQENPKNSVLWLARQQLIADKPNCQNKKCKLKAKNLQLKSDKLDQYVWRCTKNHITAIRKWSFFQKSHYFIPDLLTFLLGYLEGLSLKSLCQKTGFSYKNSALKWAKRVRYPMMKWVQDYMMNVTFRGVVEIDESLFGRKTKYHKG